MFMSKPGLFGRSGMGLSGMGLGLFDPEEAPLQQMPLAQIPGSPPMLPPDAGPVSPFPMGPTPDAPRPRVDWGQRLGNLAQGLAAAQSFQDGNFDTGSRILGSTLKGRMEQAQRARVEAAMKSQGYSDDQVALAMTNPEALGTNYNQRFGTRSVADGTAVVTGGPGGQQQSYYQPKVPDWEAYADAQGLQAGTPEYNTALQDFVLRGYGPTGIANQQALDNTRTGNKIKIEGVQQSGRLGLEGARQQNRVGLEGVRQRNRITTRGTPTYRDLNPPPPRSSRQGGGSPVKTATGPNGQKLYLRGGRWVDEQGRPAQ